MGGYADFEPSAIVRRYNADGSLDRTFSLDGATATGLFNPSAVDLTPDGDIVVVGSSTAPALAIGRYDGGPNSVVVLTEDGEFFVQGTDGDDNITVNFSPSNLHVVVNDKTFDFEHVLQPVNVFGGAGDDFITISSFRRRDRKRRRWRRHDHRIRRNRTVHRFRRYAHRRKRQRQHRRRRRG